MAGNRINMPEPRRRAAVRSMVDGLFIWEHISTTDARAKVAQSEAERLIALAIRGHQRAWNHLSAVVPDSETAERVLALARRARFSLDEEIPTNEERAAQGKYPLSSEARKLKEDRLAGFQREMLGIIKDQDEALRQASDVLVRHFQLIADFIQPRGEVIDEEIYPTGIEPGGKPGRNQILIPPRIYDMPIEELDLTVRAYNCLKRSGITKVGQILSMTEEDLLAVRNFGEKSLNELKDSLKERSLLPNAAQLEQFNESNLNGADGYDALGDDEGDENDDYDEDGNF
jgi:ribosomal protein L17